VADFPSIVADALLVSTVGGLVVLGASLAISGRRELSGHMRQLVLVYGLLAGPFLLVLLGVLRPAPIGCITRPCATEALVIESGRVGESYALEAAAKFRGGGLRQQGPPLRSDGTRTLVPVVAWAIGTVIVAVRAGRRRLEVRRLFRAASPLRDERTQAESASIARELGLRRGPRLLRHPDVPVPVVGGVLRAAMFLPVGFELQPGVERRIILLHELAHVRRRDAAVSLAIELASAIFWCNPLVWLAARLSARNQELAADSCVLEGGVQPSVYAGYLLSTWRAVSNRPDLVPSPTHALTGGCELSDRIQAVLDPRTRHARPSRALTMALTFGFVALATCMAWSPAVLQGAGLLTRERTSADVRLDTTLLNHAALDSILRPLVINRMTDRYIAGAAVSIVHDGRLVYAEGFGDREVFTEDPVDPARTIFRIGSITKVLTGVAILQLVDRGLLDLDADVNEYLDAFQVPDTFEEPVRVRHLLTHTAGFDQIGLDRHVESPDAARPPGDWLAENLVRIRPPGEVSAYDTYAITLAGYLVEAVSRLDYEEYLRLHVFAPLAMHRSGIRIPPALVSDVALGYGFAGEWEVLSWEYMNTNPASTVNSTAVDMAHLGLMLLGEGRFQGRRVLSEEHAKAMLTRQYTNHPDQPGYGYTLFENQWNGITTFSHGGSMAGYAAMLYLVPEHELGIFISSNQESGALIDAVVSPLLAALFPGAVPPAKRDPYTGRVDLARFTGTYANNVYHHGDPTTGWRREPFDLEATGDGALMFDGAPARPVGLLAFERDDGLLLTFREDASGEITHLFVRQTVYEKLED
jgi:CubicO group peptidase (beta-lactamase class C family)